MRPVRLRSFVRGDPAPGDSRAVVHSACPQQEHQVTRMRSVQHGRHGVLEAIVLLEPLRFGCHPDTN